MNKASARVFGLQKREAIYKEGLGAILLPKGVSPSDLDNFLIPRRNLTPIEKPYPIGHLAPLDTVLPTVDYLAIQDALALVFEDNHIQKSRSALILYKGQLIGEKYIDGFGPDTPVLGWSMTKSIMATIYGILEYQGNLKVSDPVALKDWANDERARISIDDLLRMQSGLAFEEDYSIISDVTNMLFNESDMAQVAIDKPSIAKPGDIWSYSSGTTNILSKYLKSFSSDAQKYLDFPYAQLIDKIGMHSMVIETDMVQTFVGSSYGWASTRDWARFGLLYLQNGVWDGSRIFSENWVNYISTPTKASNGAYGAHFWLNADGNLKDVPRDLYSANGHDGQHVYVIPSKDLVIVRTGLGERPDYRANDFIAAIVAAVE
jgi:CubicO group peptidase (beta-lactamase class C family)